MSIASEENGIREAINYYAEGMRTGRVETLKEGFISRRYCAVTSATK